MKKNSIYIYLYILFALCLTACGSNHANKPVQDIQKLMQKGKCLVNLGNTCAAPNQNTLLIESLSWYLPGDPKYEYRLLHDIDFNERLSVRNDDLQTAALNVSKGHGIVTAAEASELAWEIAPYLLQYQESSTMEWYPVRIALFGNSYWEIDYWETNMFLNNDPSPKNRIRLYDGTISVRVSALDGHVISINGPFNDSLVPDSELFSLESTEKLEKCVFPVFKPISLSMQEQYSFLLELSCLSEAFPGYDEGIDGEQTRFDDEDLQDEVSTIFKRHPLCSPESACNFGWELYDCLHAHGYIPEGYSPDKQVFYLDNVYELRIEKDGKANEGDAFYYHVYASTIDGHIIAIRAEVNDGCEIVFPSNTGDGTMC